MSNKHINWFKEIGLQHVPQVGGKGASLGELMRAQISIPDGFVVTTEAFKTFIEELGQSPQSDEKIVDAISRLNPDNIDIVATVTGKIRSRIEEFPLPVNLSEAIAAACVELTKNGDPVAVRSSATSEDSEEASFAGLQDTYLWVKDSTAIIDAVRKCWASLYSPESVNYRLRLKLPEEQLAMGVVVQRMVNSRCSGVMFTRSPTTGDKSVVTIEGSWGLGSSIVSGEVTPDKFVVNKITSDITNREIAKKTIEHVPAEQGGINEQAVDEERQQQSCLSDDEIRALTAIAKKVEQHYGKPQDIEWAIDQDDNILLLQSRPETVWASKEKDPVAKPAAKPFDHIFSVLGGQQKK